MNPPTYKIVLASTSPFRRQLLERLGLPFSVIDPQVDETALRGEAPQALASRLAQAKAHAVLTSETLTVPEAESVLIIGSDQVVVLDDQILGKPGGHGQAVSQLQRLSGRTAYFHTALCVLNSATRRTQLDLVTSTVLFRRLTDAQIGAYLAREPAYNCAGSFKSEGLGITLLDKITSDDPTALIGLPLISLVKMLAHEGVAIP